MHGTKKNLVYLQLTSGMNPPGQAKTITIQAVTEIFVDNFYRIVKMKSKSFRKSEELITELILLTYQLFKYNSFKNMEASSKKECGDFSD